MMPTVTALDHVNIQTRAVAATARFFVDGLDLAARPPFPGAVIDKVAWMFDSQGRALIHITLPRQTFAEDAERPLRPDTGALTRSLSKAQTMQRSWCGSTGWRCRFAGATSPRSVCSRFS